MNESFTLEEAKDKLQHYCGYQERCHQEVERKLNSMNLIAEVKEHIILYLMEHDFLNEERFAKSFARGKFRMKKWGRKRIVNELKFRNVSTYNIKSALNEFSEADYLKTFNELAEKRVQVINEVNLYKKRKKLADYLLYRGWESTIVYAKVTELIP
tara:strand:+ start:167484 stop:167951 length:468 start_codon:yes stop_codon:yes gene_type:complete